MADPVQVLIVGEGPVAASLVSMIGALGWSTEVTGDVPLVAQAVDVVVVTSHHEEVDAPAIRGALKAGTPYVGAMGSRPTQARRREWLLANGVSLEEMARLRAPIGLDIGADEPGEIAVAILAEVIAVRRGITTAQSISERGGPIHVHLAHGEATCPTG